MRASAYILVQRYLDGELNELELEAFHRDLSNDPVLASILEREVQLDSAIINDSYSIEPPTELRAAVLGSISDSGSSWNLNFFGRMFLSTAIGAVLLLTSLVGVGTDSMRPVDASVMNPTPASASTSASTSASISTSSVELLQANRSRSESRAVISTTTSNSESSSSSEPFTEAESPEVFIEPTRLAQLPFESMQRSLREQQSDMFLGLGLASMPSLPGGLFGGMVGTNTASLRYELDLLEGSPVFVEAGGLQQPRTSTAYVNGEATSVVASGITPFLSIGLAGVLFDQNTIGYAINGSASIGITSVGPLAMADVSASILDLGFSTVDVGVRLSTLFDVGPAQRAYFNATPFLRVGLPLY